MFPHEVISLFVWVMSIKVDIRSILIEFYKNRILSIGFSSQLQKFVHSVRTVIFVKIHPPAKARGLLLREVKKEDLDSFLQQGWKLGMKFFKTQQSILISNQ